MHLDLLKAIPWELRDRLDHEFELAVKSRSAEINVIWPSLWPIISITTRDDFVIQACKQYLSHHQCVISTLMCGLSFSPFYLNGGPIISRDAAALYLNSGIRAVYNIGEKLNLNWLLLRHRKLWVVMCKEYLKLNHDDVGFSEHLTQFAYDQFNEYEETA
jgi:hypothetical protein